MKDKVIILYEYFYRQVSGNLKYKFKPKDQDHRMIDKYLTNLTDSHGNEYLYEYFCYQFSRYADLETRFGKGKVMLSWIIGEAALKKWREASPEERYWGDQLKLTYHLTNPFPTKIEPLNISQNKERERRRFYSTDRGLIHCTENNLWDAKSKYCIFCKYKNYCK